MSHSSVVVLPTDIDAVLSLLITAGIGVVAAGLTVVRSNAGKSF